jgi:hypothetical protein
LSKLLKSQKRVGNHKTKPAAIVPPDLGDLQAARIGYFAGKIRIRNFSRAK